MQENKFENGTPLTELNTKELGFIDEALRLSDNLFFYKHPNGSVRLAWGGEDIWEDINTVEQIQALYYGFTGKKLI